MTICHLTIPKGLHAGKMLFGTAGRSFLHDGTVCSLLALNHAAKPPALLDSEAQNSNNNNGRREFFIYSIS